MIGQPSPKFKTLVTDTLLPYRGLSNAEIHRWLIYCVRKWWSDQCLPEIETETQTLDSIVRLELERLEDLQQHLFVCNHIAFGRLRP